MWKSACESAHTCPLINRKSHRKAMTKIPSKQNQVAYLMFQVQSEVNPLAQTPLNSLFTASWMCVPWILSSQCWTHTHTHTETPVLVKLWLCWEGRAVSPVHLSLNWSEISSSCSCSASSTNTTCSPAALKHSLFGQKVNKVHYVLAYCGFRCCNVGWMGGQMFFVANCHHCYLTQRCVCVCACVCERERDRPHFFPLRVPFLFRKLLWSIRMFVFFPSSLALSFIRELSVLPSV